MANIPQPDYDADDLEQSPLAELLRRQTVAVFEESARHKLAKASRQNLEATIKARAYMTPEQAQGVLAQAQNAAMTQIANQISNARAQGLGGVGAGEPVVPWQGDGPWIKQEKRKAPARIGTKSQEQAVVHELMDSLEYLIADIEQTAKRYPQLEAVARNWAMRRAIHALDHGRAML